MRHVDLDAGNTFSERLELRKDVTKIQLSISSDRMDLGLL